jgi:alpha-glucoside transport system substrate-binding protein
MRYMNDPAFGLATMARGKIPANTSLDVSRIDDPKTRELAAIIDVALENDQFKFDGSDLMPEEIGAGVFWDEMMTLFERDGADFFGALVRIEAAWSALDGG